MDEDRAGSPSPDGGGIDDDEAAEILGAMLGLAAAAPPPARAPRAAAAEAPAKRRRRATFKVRFLFWGLLGARCAALGAPTRPRAARLPRAIDRDRARMWRAFRAPRLDEPQFKCAALGGRIRP
jgi:hypothetical protein